MSIASSIRNLIYFKSTNSKQSRRLDIGSGTFGAVTRCGERALKLPLLRHPHPTDDAWQRQLKQDENSSSRCALENEVKILQHLTRHPHIVTIFSFSVENGIEMEFLHGGDIEQYIASQPELAMREKLEWLLQAAQALQHVHCNGIVHNDFALRNLLIDKHKRLKLIDFSNSVLECEREEWDHTSTFQADMFDFGSVAYSILTWQPYHLKLLEYQIDFDRETRGYDKPRGWPVQADLPSIDGVPQGDFLLKCWLKGFRDMQCVCDDLQTRLAPYQSRSGEIGIFPRAVISSLKWVFDQCWRLFRPLWYCLVRLRPM